MLDDEGPKHHPESWNNNANVFFIDQPIGVGFSYADYGEHVVSLPCSSPTGLCPHGSWYSYLTAQSNTEEAAEDVAVFVALFFEHFTKFKGRRFHMAGESYGGRYLPVFASYLYDQNSALAKLDLTPVNLVSVMIGMWRVFCLGG